MNDEYLWQKTGEDPETMELENVLAVFRYREDDPPAVPVTEKQQSARRWRFAVAFAVPVFGAVLLAAVLWLPIGNGVDESDVTFIYEPAPAAVEGPAPNPEPVARPTELPKQPVRRGEVQPTVASLRRKPVVKTHPQKTAVALTAEEQYAYQQLMLALTISSSKLNVVRNAINGVEDTQNDTKQNQNNR